PCSPPGPCCRWVPWQSRMPPTSAPERAPRAESGRFPGTVLLPARKRRGRGWLGVHQRQATPPTPSSPPRRPSCRSCQGHAGARKRAVERCRDAPPATPWAVSRSAYPPPASVSGGRRVPGRGASAPRPPRGRRSLSLARSGLESCKAPGLVLRADPPSVLSKLPSARAESAPSLRRRRFFALLHQILLLHLLVHLRAPHPHTTPASS